MIYYNGQYLNNENNIINYNDSGFTTAIGIFDSMLALNGDLIHGPDHFDRILFDCKNVIGLTPTISYSDFNQICKKLLDKNTLSNGHARVRTTITGGIVAKPLDEATSLSILIHTATANAPENMPPLKCAIILDFPRIAGCPLENSKRLDYSRSYAARRAAEKLGADESILINTNGNIACAATSNIFIQENGKLITPPLSEGVLAGVTRKNILKENPNAKEETISIKRLESANKIFLTNSFFGLREVTLIS